MARPDPKVLLADTELLAMLGEINLEWDEIELALWALFDALLPSVGWPITFAMFYVHQNHRSRRDMIEAIAPWALHGKDREFKAIKSLMRRVKGAARKRNDLFHGIWEFEDHNGTKVPKRMPIRNNYSQFLAGALTRADIRRTRDQLAKLSEDLRAILYTEGKKTRLLIVPPMRPASPGKSR